MAKSRTMPRALAKIGLRKRLREEFGIDHPTIQIEPEGFAEAGLHA